MSADIKYSTKRLEPALRYLAKNGDVRLKVVCEKFKVPSTDVWAWLTQFNRGRRDLPVRIIDTVLSDLEKAPPVKAIRPAVQAAIEKGEKLGTVSKPIEVDKPSDDLGPWLQKQGLKFETVKTFQVKVTPDLAVAWLRFNTGNRSPSKTKIRKFSTAIAAGKWMINGETLKFSSTGRLLDGQSRLQALVAANVPAVLEVRGGLPDSMQECMDTGEARAHKHQLEMLGEKNPNEVAAALRLVFFWEKGIVAIQGGQGRLQDQMTNTAIRETLERHPAIRESVGRCLPIKPIMAVSQAAFFCYLFSKADEVRAQSFFKRLATGANLDVTNPIYLLRERLMSDRVSQAKLGKRDKFALIIKAWNAWYADKPMTRLVFTPDETFPEIAGVERPKP